MNFAHAIFSGLIPGTIVTITMDSGAIYDSVRFHSYDPLTGIVRFLEQGSISPPTSSFIYVGVRKIESVSF